MLLLLLHVCAVLTILAAGLVLITRTTLHLIGRYMLDTNRERFIAATSKFGVGGPCAFWIGPVQVSRCRFPGSEVSAHRFHGENGPARTLAVVFAGVEWNIDLSDTAARGWLISPQYVVAVWIAFQFSNATSIRGAVFLLGLVAANGSIAYLILRCDALVTALHYAHRGSDLDQHEAWLRGRSEGIRYEAESQRFRTGQRYEAPPYPANPYAA